MINRYAPQNPEDWRSELVELVPLTFLQPCLTAPARLSLLLTRPRGSSQFAFRSQGGWVMYDDQYSTARIHLASEMAMVLVCLSPGAKSECVCKYGSESKYQAASLMPSHASLPQAAPYSSPDILAICFGIEVNPSLSLPFCTSFLFSFIHPWFLPCFSFPENAGCLTAARYSQYSKQSRLHTDTHTKK